MLVKCFGVALATLLLLLVSSALGGKVLFVFPLSSKSMVNLFEPLVKGLIEKGHQVKIVTPVKFKMDSTNLTQLQPFGLEEIFSDYPEPFQIRQQSKLFKWPMEFQVKYCHLFYQHEEFRKLENETFDVIIANIQYNDCFAGLFHKIGSPIIFLSSLPIPSVFPEQFGNVLPSSFVPNCMLGDISTQLRFIQRTKNVLYNVYFHLMLHLWTRPPLEAIYRQYLGGDTPTISEIYGEQASLILMNSHFSLNGPRPLLPNIVEIGGIHCHSIKNHGQPRIPEDLQNFIETGKDDGFIVFSLGSIVKAVHMPESVREAFLQSFSKLKQRVIWKWEKDGGMPNLPSNVKLVKWLPQQELLAHPSIKLFITHGGLLSTQEAIYHGVPVLGMPVFVDQDANMKQAELLGFGVKGEILNLTEPKLTLWIRKILDNPDYQKQAQRLSRLFKDQPQSPLKRAIYWVEYVMRYKGASQLVSSAKYLNWIQYYCLDVIGFLIMIFVAILFSVRLLVKYGLDLIFYRNSYSARQSKRKVC